MWDAITKAGIAEIALLFVVLFLCPLLFLLVRRLKRYETKFGYLEGGAPPPPKPKKEKAPPPAPAAEKPKVPDNVFPYKSRQFLSPPERQCLEALQQALGAEVDIFPKVALWETVEPTESDPGYAERLHQLDFDYLVCDKKLGQPLTAVMFKPGKGRPAGPVDMLTKICAAAGANLVFIDMAEQYDAEQLKKELGLPDLDI